MFSSILGLVFIQLSIVDKVISKNNVCKNYVDYWSFNLDHNENCMYNPDMYLDAPQLLEKYFGKYDVHEIPTADGYFVTTFRVPRNNSRGAILMRHSAVTDSHNWISFGKDSPAYFYWKNGFELWLTNTRGTYYSQKHVKYTTDDWEFWNFSFHEIAIYDLRASLEYIYKFNGNVSCSVMTYSMGSTEALVYSSLFPEEASKYSKVNILITPPSTFMFSKRKYLTVIGEISRILFERAKIGKIFARDQKLTKIIQAVCPKIPFICISAFNIVGGGWPRRGEEPLLIPLVFNTLGSTSFKSLSHLGQFFFPGKFTWYDYKQKNSEVYGTTYPPEYPVWKIVVPTYLVYFGSDGFIPTKDVDMLYAKLSKNAKKYGRLFITGFSHFDAFIGKDRNEVYYKILNLLYDIFSE